MRRHAYMIMAHGEFGVLGKLLELLDDDRNDIYLHVDAKVADFDTRHFKTLVQKANLVFTQRTRVSWGGYSQIQCELLLLREATKKTHSYYHLVSGVDLPLVGQDQIHRFFDEHNGTEFVHFDNITNVNYRLKYYYPFQEILNRHRGPLASFVQKATTVSQEALGVDRLRRDQVRLRFGAAWFSITDALARYVLSREAEIRTIFRRSLCCDEVFLQTILWDSAFRDRLFRHPDESNYMACLRYVDWQRGNPYIFTNSDYQDLTESSFLFARKFSEIVDAAIVDRIYQHVKYAGS